MTSPAGSEGAVGGGVTQNLPPSSFPKGHLYPKPTIAKFGMHWGRSEVAWG